MAVVGAALVSASGAGAVTIGPFTASGPGTVAVVQATPDLATLTYDDQSMGPDTFTITGTATTTGPVTFDYNSSGFYSYYDVTASASAFSNGASTQLYSTGPADCCSSPSDGFDYTGSVTLDLVAGQTYGFSVTGANFDSAQTIQGTFTVSAVPEPAAWALMILGFGLVGGAMRRRSGAITA